MQIVLKDNCVIAFYEDSQQVAGLYPDCEIVHSDQTCNIGDSDPRTDAEKAKVYRDQRWVAYPILAEQFDMMYWDHVNGTSNWLDTIAQIKKQYPKV